MIKFIEGRGTKYYYFNFQIGLPEPNILFQDLLIDILDNAA